MTSNDESWKVERYPNWNGQRYEYSYGCPNANLMGYFTIEALMFDLKKVIKAKELVDYSLDIGGRRDGTNKTK